MYGLQSISRRGHHANVRRSFSSSLKALKSKWNALVEVKDVQELVKTPNSRIRFIDASWYLDSTRNANKEYLKERIPGAVRFDLETIADSSNPLPHMLPRPEDFQQHIEKLGIHTQDRLIIYGGKGCFSAARCWWMFRVFGHEQVHILNGGLEEWKKAQCPVVSGHVTPEDKSSSFSKKAQESFVATFHSDFVYDAPKMLQLAQSPNKELGMILDARGLARYSGNEPEPRAGLRAGHIPGSIHFHFARCIVPGDPATFKSIPMLREEFSDIDLTGQHIIATSCGSGVTAAMLTFSLHLLGVPLHRVPVYDGSWSEWGSQASLPVETSSSS